MNPDPLPLNAVFEELMIQLRMNLHGQNPPLTAQAVYVLVNSLPREVCVDLGSRAFRTAVRLYFAERELHFYPTRRDVEQGALYLKRNGMLPPWVNSTTAGGF